MKEYTFSSKKLCFIASGYYGSYYRVKGKRYGVKILNGGANIKSTSVQGDFYSASRAKESEGWSDSKRIIDTLQMARKRANNGPRPMGLAIVKHYDKRQKRYTFHCGYVMSHVAGKPVDKSNMTSADYNRLRRAKERVKSAGITIDDDHTGNIMKYGKKFIFIDPDSWHVH